MLRLGLFAALTALLLLPLGAMPVWAQNPLQVSPPNAADPYALPAGNSQVLVMFIQKLMLEPPQSAEQLAKRNQAVLKAAEKILSSKPTNEQLMLAVRAKSAMLLDPQELAAFEEEVKKAGKKNLVRIVHGRLLAVKLDRARSNAAAFRELLDEVKQFLGDKQQFQLGDEQLVLQAVQAAERTGDHKLAAEANEDLAKLLPAQPPFGAIAKRMQASARRWNLPGNPMHLEGKTLDGRPFDASSFRGKVVLVDFWATWCGPCKAEIPNIKKNYENYRDKGFEVVGVSIDTGPREKLVEFVQQEALPWVVCRDGDTPAKIAEYYGIHSIPTMILIGRDGKVVSLNARGAGLGPLVEKALAATAAGTEDIASDGKFPAAETDLKHDKKAPKAELTAANKKIAVAPSRTWTDASGKFKVEAKFRGLINKTVKLECEDGRVVELPLEKLSDDDRAYIKKRKTGAAP